MVVSLSTTEVICFDEIVVAAASNYKVLHLASVISVSITGKGCRYISIFQKKQEGDAYISKEQFLLSV